MAHVDIYQPGSEVAKREEGLIFAERAIGAAEDELKLLLNSDDWLNSYTPVDLPDTDPIDLNLPAVLENALKNRPDIKAADLNIEAAKIQEKNATDKLLPDLAVVGGVGLAGAGDAYGHAVNNSLRNACNLCRQSFLLSRTVCPAMLHWTSADFPDESRTSLSPSASHSQPSSNSK